MRFRALLGNPNKPKERVSVSFLAKSEKAAKAKLRRLFPKLANTAKKKTTRRAKRRRAK
jgi:hypothetical protein